MKKIILLSILILTIFGFYLVFRGQNSENINTGENNQIICGIEQCHGLEITCGENVPEFCTAIYQLGDFCQRFINCRVIENECQMVETEKFDSCKDCISECERIEGVEAFDCEAGCRQQFE